jgi:hypothetical protein
MEIFIAHQHDQFSGGDCDGHIKMAFLMCVGISERGCGPSGEGMCTKD